MPQRPRLTGGTLRTRPIETAMSCSVTRPLSTMILRRRVPSFFCNSRSSSTCLTKRRPSSTSASAIRSPKVLMAAIGCQIALADDFAQELDQIGGRGQIPEQALLGGFLQFKGCLAIERVGGGDEDRLAHAIKRKDAPTLAGLGREGAGQFDVDVVFVE